MNSEAYRLAQKDLRANTEIVEYLEDRLGELEHEHKHATSNLKYTTQTQTHRLEAMLGERKARLLLDAPSFKNLDDALIDAVTNNHPPPTADTAQAYSQVADAIARFNERVAQISEEIRERSKDLHGHLRIRRDILTKIKSMTSS